MQTQELIETADDANHQTIALASDEAQVVSNILQLRQAFRRKPFSGWARCLNMAGHVAPDMQVDSVLDLSVGQFRRLHIDGLLLDLDCTLKDYHAEEIPAEVLAWLNLLGESGFRLCLLSNGRVRKIERFASHLNIPFVAKAFKPFPFGCRQAIRKLGLPVHRIAMIGDQLLADVLAGRFAGIFTILVRPTSPLEPWFTRLKRPFERTYLRWWNGIIREQPMPENSIS